MTYCPGGYRSPSAIVILSFLIAAAVIGIASPAHAQSPPADIRWSEPINLSNTVTSSGYPAVVADLYGLVHVFWIENDGGTACAGD